MNLLLPTAAVLLRSTPALVSSFSRIHIVAMVNKIFSACVISWYCFMHSSTGASKQSPPSIPVQKLQCMLFGEIQETWLIYSGGCRIPPEGSDLSHILSIYVIKKSGGEMLKSLVPFGSRIVDFMCLPTVRALRGQLTCLFIVFSCIKKLIICMFVQQDHRSHQLLQSWQRVSWWCQMWANLLRKSSVGVSKFCG